MDNHSLIKRIAAKATVRAGVLSLLAVIAFAWAVASTGQNDGLLGFSGRAGILLAVSVGLTLFFDTHLIWLAYLFESVTTVALLFVQKALRLVGRPVALALACLYVVLPLDVVPDGASAISRIDDVLIAVALVYAAHRAAKAVPRMPSPFAEPGGVARLAAALAPAYALLWAVGLAPV